MEGILQMMKSCKTSLKLSNLRAPKKLKAFSQSTTILRRMKMRMQMLMLMNRKDLFLVNRIKRNKCLNLVIMCSKVPNLLWLWLKMFEQANRQDQRAKVHLSSPKSELPITRQSKLNLPRSSIIERQSSLKWMALL